MVATDEGDEAVVDGGGGLVGELLVEDAAGEGVEGGVRALEGRRVVRIDEAAEEGVGGAEVEEGPVDLSGEGEGAGRRREDPAEGGVVGLRAGIAAAAAAAAGRDDGLVLGELAGLAGSEGQLGGGGGRVWVGGGGQDGRKGVIGITHKRRREGDG